MSSSDDGVSNAAEWLIWRKMVQIDNNITYSKKINFVTIHLRFSFAVLHYNTGENFNNFVKHLNIHINHYWNIHIKCKISEQLKYNKYNNHSCQSIEKYTISHIEKCKHLITKLSEYEIISIYKVLQQFKNSIYVTWSENIIHGENKIRILNTILNFTTMIITEYIINY